MFLSFNKKIWNYALQEYNENSFEKEDKKNKLIVLLAYQTNV